MIINKLTCESNNKNITVTLSYDECRDIANGLYYAVSKSDNGAKFQAIQAKCKFLFDMVKHGNIQVETIEKMAEIVKAGEQE